MAASGIPAALAKDMVAAMPRSGTPQKPFALPPAVRADADAGAAARTPAPWVPARRLLIAAAAGLTVTLLFLAYLRVSRTYPENSDESNDLLMAWDMLHGIVLLARGARDQVPRGQGWPRMLLTAGLMFAPQLGVGVFVLLLSLGHIGTAVPLLLTWLVIDRCQKRWYVPVMVGLLLTWVLVADPLVLLVGVAPLVAVCALRVARALARRGDEPAGAVLRAHAFELALAVAAILAQGLASLAGRLVQAYLHPLPYQLAPLHTCPKHAWVTAQGLLALFGAKPQGPAAAMAFAVLHLAGVALVAWAVLRVARHFVSWPDMISQILLVAMVLNVAAYVPSTLADATALNAREFAVVLPFGAVLARRALGAGMGDSLRDGRRRFVIPALLAAAVGYAASLGWAAAQPSVPPMNTRLASFLAAHHLTSGIGGELVVGAGAPRR